MPADPIRRTIKLGPAAHELRRHVGPTTWVVLEEMLQRSTGDDGHVVAQVSIRSLASSLGLAKDDRESRRRPPSRSRCDRRIPGPLPLRCLRGRLVSPRRPRRLPLARRPVAALRPLARCSPLLRCSSVCSSLLLCCSSVSVRPPLVRPALPPSRGLRPVPVSVSRFARSSISRQVPARRWEWS